MVYDVLSKPEKRKLYDTAGELGIKGGKTEQPWKSDGGSEHSDDSCTESDEETFSDECDEEANNTFRKRFFSGPFAGGFGFTGGFKFTFS